MKKIIYSEAIKNSANLEKYKDKANWREDNPKSKSYIGNKPIKYKEMDKLFKQLQSVVKEIDNYIKNISLNNNILKFSYNNGDSKEIDLSQYQDLHLKSLEVDNLNKKLVGTLTDNVTKIEVDINDLINVNLNAGGLEDTNKRLKLTLSDDSILYIDLSKIYDKDVKNISLDDTNKKLVITKEDNSTFDIDLTDLYNRINEKVSKVSSSDNVIVRFNGVNGDIQDSNITIDDNNKIGILTTNPEAYLHINKQTTSVQGVNVSIILAGDDDYPTIQFWNKDNIAKSFIRQEASDNSLSIYTNIGNDTSPNWNKRLNILNNGNVGIGIDNPEELLHINGNVIINGSNDNLKIFSSGDNTGIEIGNPNEAYTSYIDFHSTGTGEDYSTRILSEKNSKNMILYASEIKINGIKAFIEPIPTKNLKDILTFENNWRDYGYQYTSKISKSATGLVTINGLITGGNNGTLVGQLPAEYKPLSRQLTIQFCENGYVRVDIRTDGYIEVLNQGTRDNSSWVGLQFNYLTF